MKEQQLIFAYNAGSDLFSTVTDFAHKILSPSTYQCSLCALTYGNLGMKNEWKAYINALPVKTVFFHKDEFLRQYDLKVAFPAVFIKAGDVLELLIDKEEIDDCKSLQQLKEKLSAKLFQYDQRHHSNI